MHTCKLKLLMIMFLCVCTSSGAKPSRPDRGVDVRPDPGDPLDARAGYEASGASYNFHTFASSTSQANLNFQTKAEGLHSLTRAPDARQRSKRHLLQAAPKITRVATPQQLLTAISQGVEHIQITAHLDMTGSPVPNNPMYDEDTAHAYLHAVYINSTLTATVTGACEGAVPAPLSEMVEGVPLQPLAAGQCLFLTDLGGFMILGSGNTWIDNLYVRAVYTGRTPAFEQSLMSTGDLPAESSTSESSASNSSTSGGNMPNVYLTGVQLQGDNVFERSGEEQSVLGLAVAAPTYVSGCSIGHTGGHQEAIRVHSASVNIINSTVTDNTMSRGVEHAAVTVTLGGLWLQGTSLARNSAPVLLRTAEDEIGTIVSDTPLEYLTTVADEDSRRSLYIPAARAPPLGLKFLQGSEPWFLSTTAAQEFSGRPLASAAHPPPSPSELTQVSTAAKLQEAMQQGARHIVVVAHLDLSSLELVDSVSESGIPNLLLGIVRDTTRTIMGNCTGAGDPPFTIPGAPFVPLKPGQCILLADAHLLTPGSGSLWVHNLYVRHKATQRASRVLLMYIAVAGGTGGQLWMTGCTLQGTGAYDSTSGTGGLWISSRSQAYVEGCRFLSLGGVFPAIKAISKKVHIVNSTVSSTFIPDVNIGVVAADSGATVWLQGTSVSSNQAVLPLTASTDHGDRTGRVFSDREDFWFSWNADGELERHETGPVPPYTSEFLSRTHEWFVSVLKEVASAPGLSELAILSTAAPVPSMAPVSVTAARELVSAVSRGVRHIRVMDHIDLTSEELPTDGSSHLGHPSTTTHTITGNCSGAVPATMLDAAAAAERKAGQCAIIVDSPLLRLIHGRLWMHSLFVALRRTSRTPPPSASGEAFVIIASGQSGDEPAGASLWLTQSVLQGDTDAASRDVHKTAGIAVYGGAFAGNDVQVRKCGGEASPVYVSGGAAASFEACSFADNVRADRDEGVGSISFTTGAGSITWLKNVTFTDNTGADIVTNTTLASTKGRVFSSEPGLEYHTYNGKLSEEAVPVPVQTAHTTQFLSFSDPWMLQTAKEAGYTINSIEEAPPAAAPPFSGPSPLISTDTLVIEDNGLAVLPPGNGSASPPYDATRDEQTSQNDGNNSTEPAEGDSTPDERTSLDGDDHEQTSQNEGNNSTEPAEDDSTSDEGTPLNGAHGDNRTEPGKGALTPADVPASPEGDMDAAASDAPNITSIAVVVVLVAVVVAVCVFFALRLRRQRKNPSPALARVPHASATQPGWLPIAGQAVAGQKQGITFMQSQQHATAIATGLTTTVYSHPTQSTTLTTASATTTGAPTADVPVNGGAARALSAPAKDQLQAELTAMYENKERFLDKYRVLEPQERRVGGQGLVQFMSWKHGAEPVAVKFFLARGAYEAELQLYSEGGLRSMMPEKVTEVPAGAAQSVRGYAFPPCIVLKKGQSLQDWRDIVQPRLETVFDALSHIAQKLEQLHASGWVHRDLKPGNILRLPHLHSWTLMDFGSAARTGQQLPSSHAVTTLKYCPPEAVLATKGGTPFEVLGAADIWALGLLSYELLTQKNPFLFMTPEDIHDRLCGVKPLLWEEEGPYAQQVLKPLGVLRGTVLACLHRDPAQRPTAADVCRDWKRIIANTSSHQ